MPIGDSPEPVSYNKEAEKEIKFQMDIEFWWDNLEEATKDELMENYYPDKSYIHDPDELFEGLDWKIKKELYLENNPQLTMGPDDYPF